MRLIDLEPQFHTYIIKPNFPVREVMPDGTIHEVLRDQVFYGKVDSITEAQGIHFLCPACFAANNGPIGTHAVLCWFLNRGVPDDATPGPGRWTVFGTGYHDLTIGPGQNGKSSIQLLGDGCQWHGNIVNGIVTPA